MAVIRVIHYCATNPLPNKVHVPYTWILNKMFLRGMPQEFVETVRKKRRGLKGAKHVLVKQIKRKKMQTMIRSVQKWDWKVIAINYVMNPTAFQAGGGRYDEVPMEVQIQVHKLLDKVSKRVNDKYIYFETIEELLRTITESYGNYKTFLTKEEMRHFEKAQETKRVIEFANGNTSNSDEDTDDADTSESYNEDIDIETMEQHSEEEKHAEDLLSNSKPMETSNAIDDIDDDLLHDMLKDDKDIIDMLLSQNTIESNEIDEQDTPANQCDDEYAMSDIDTKTQAILVDRNKIGRFKNKWNIVRSGSRYSTHFQLNDVLARSMQALAKCMAVRKILPIKYLLDRDQAMMMKQMMKSIVIVMMSMKRVIQKITLIIITIIIDIEANINLIFNLCSSTFSFFFAIFIWCFVCLDVCDIFRSGSINIFTFFFVIHAVSV
eukprot:195356_1